MLNHRHSTDVPLLRPVYKDLISAPFCLDLLLLKNRVLKFHGAQHLGIVSSFEMAMEAPEQSVYF